METIIHYGMPKTATSFLQYFFYINHKVLAQNGIFYPQGGFFAHFDCGMLGKETDSLPIEYFDFYVKQAKQRGFKKLLISNELFFYRDLSYYSFLQKEKTCSISFVRFFTEFNEKINLQFIKQFSPWNYHFASPSFILEKILEKTNLFKKNYHFCFNRYKKEIVLKFLDFLGLSDFNEFNFNIDNILAQNRSILPVEALFLNEIQVLPLNSYTYEALLCSFLEKEHTHCKKEYLLVAPEKYYQVAREQSSEIEQISRIIDNPNYGKESLQYLDGKDRIPWTRLPQDLWEEIFENLPQKIQNEIYRALPPSDRKVYEVVGLFQDQNYVPNYFRLKNEMPHDITSSYETLLQFCQKLPFDASLRTSPYLFEERHRYLKNKQKLVYRDEFFSYQIQEYQELYRNMLLLELSNKVEPELFEIIQSNKNAYSGEFLEALLETVITRAHRQYMLDSAHRLIGKTIYFWGYGSSYESTQFLFNKCRVKAILCDVPHEETQMNEIPIVHPDKELSSNTVLPIVVFSNNASIICKKIKETFPQFIDIITCVRPVTYQPDLTAKLQGWYDRPYTNILIEYYKKLNELNMN